MILESTETHETNRGRCLNRDLDNKMCVLLAARTDQKCASSSPLFFTYYSFSHRNKYKRIIFIFPVPPTCLTRFVFILCIHPFPVYIVRCFYVLKEIGQQAEKVLFVVLCVAGFTYTIQLNQPLMDWRKTHVNKRVLELHGVLIIV